jgi:hypothetical protein
MVLTVVDRIDNYKESLTINYEQIDVYLFLYIIKIFFIILKLFYIYLSIFWFLLFFLFECDF